MDSQQEVHSPSEQEEERIEVVEEEKEALTKVVEEREETHKEEEDNKEKMEENTIKEEVGQASQTTEKSEINPLRITIITSGTRGDVQPYAVLAQALQNRGHKVVLGTEERMHSFVDSFGIPYAHIAGDPTSVLFTKEGQQMLNDGRIMVLMNEMKKLQAPTYEECLGDYTKACEGADVIICGPLVMTQGYCLAEKFKAVWIPLILGPSYPTEVFPLHMISHTSFFFKFFNKITYNFVFFMMWQSESSQINKWRTKVLGLPAMSGGILGAIEKQKNCTVINAYSEYLIPGEKRASDWPEQIKISGFLFPPAGFVPLSPQLEEFVAEGPAPIYLGFGSMPAPNPQKLIDIVYEVVGQLNVRVVLMAGWTAITDEIKEKNKNVFVAESVPHDWLFPRCACLVHHCGVGTTAAALRAGVPSIGVPVYLDQPFWAFRLKSLGVASDPIPFQKLNAKLLIEGIQKVLASDSMKVRAKQIANDISQVDGTQQAVDLVERAAQIPLFPK